jgi:DedD protein
MKNNWTRWALGIGVGVIIFIALSYKSSHKDIPLNEIFPTEEAYPVNVEYAPEETQTAAAVPVETVKAPVKKAVETPKVVVPVSQPATSPASVPSTSSVQVKSMYFAVQVASSKEKDKADQMAQKLKAKSLDSYVIMKDLGEKGIWYRIYVGKYMTKAEADAALAQVKTDYPNSFVVSLKNQ